MHSGPTITVELSDTPVDVVADASNTARFLVAILDYICAIAGRTHSLEISLSQLVAFPQHALDQSIPS